MKDNKNGIYITNLETVNHYNCNILYDLDNSSSTAHDVIEDLAICYSENIKIPNNISNKINSLYQKNNGYTYSSNNNPYNAVFKFGWSEGECYSNALVFDANELSKTDQQFYLFNWNLPKLETQIQSNSMVYSHYNNSLISIGGYHSSTNARFMDEVYCLSFNDDVNKEWRWKQYTKIPTPKGCISSVLIDHDTKLIIAGGYSASGGYCTDVEIHDLKLQNDTKSFSKLSNFDHQRHSAGLYYDKFGERIFLGGGFENCSLNSVEWFDVEKNKWNLTKIPNTNNRHDWTPILWNEQNKDILYIASVESCSIENIDLRDNQKKWKVIYESSKLEKVVFGAQMKSRSGLQCRLLR